MSQYLTIDRDRLSVNCSTLFADLPFAARAERVRAAGFTAIESWWPFADSTPGDREVTDFVRTVRDAGLQLSALNFAGGDMAAGERGLVSVPGRESEFRDSVDVAVAIGAELGAEGFNALYGNRAEAVPAARQRALGTENLHYAAAAAAAIGATVYVEPLSAAPHYPLRGLDDVAAVIADLADAPPGSVGALADLYHLTVNGCDLGREIDDHAALVAHVQIADAPGRGAPGTGSADLAGALARLHDRGYRGRIALEYFTDSTGETAPFSWLFITE